MHKSQAFGRWLMYVACLILVLQVAVGRSRNELLVALSAGCAYEKGFETILASDLFW